MQKLFYCLASLLLLVSPFARAAEGLQSMEFSVNGVKRTALVYIPASAKTKPTPLVFVFHGHGGSSQHVERSFQIDRYWPEAISVYMQGLNTPGPLVDPAGHLAGWQKNIGDQGDRDLKFFDAVLARVKKDYDVDAKRIYATGHSNGGSFTYLLWLARGDVFAAVAPSSAVAKYVFKLTPKPVMHIAGENDPLVKFSWQKLMISGLQKVNGCSANGEPWGKQCTIYPSKNGTPVVTLIHPGGHQFDSDAPALIVKFFKEYPKR